MKTRPDQLKVVVLQRCTCCEPSRRVSDMSIGHPTDSFTHIKTSVFIDTSAEAVAFLLPINKTTATKQPKKRQNCSDKCRECC